MDQFNEQEIKSSASQVELDAYQIVVSIVTKKISANRIVARNLQSYFAILLDNNNRKPLCRLYLKGSKKYISLFNKHKTEYKTAIFSIEDISHFEKELLETVSIYDNIEGLKPQ